jgi:hypothetical protein
MLESISLAVAFICSSVAGLFDLKTTEIPDEIPYVMIAVGLIFAGVQSYQQWSYWPLLNSAIAGLGLLGFGFLMYYFGQWGGGDAKILSGVGFLLPSLPKNFTSALMFPFPLSYLFNVFLVGAGYMMVYAVAFAFLNKKIIFEFKKDLKASSNLLLACSTVLFASFLVLNWYLSNIFQTTLTASLLLKNSLLPLLATVILFLIWKFAKVVENVGFKKKIPISKLKAGDVLLDSKLWEGITEKELKKIKKSGKRFVTIKEGVRFGPSFPLALLFTIYFGDGMLLLINFLI